MRSLKFLAVFIFNSAFAQVNTSYVIKDIADLTGEMYTNAKQINTDNCRKSIDGSKVILKFEGKLHKVFKGEQVYGHSAILQELSTDEWIGYSGGLASVGMFFITDSENRNDLYITINEWMNISPVRIKNNLWAIPYDLYIKYKTEIDNNIDLYKCVIRKVKKSELINPEL